MSDRAEVAPQPSSLIPPYGRNFRLYASGHAVSIVGDRIALITLVFLVLHLSHGATGALALFYVCRVVPTLVGGLLVGVIVDHFDRRRLMLACDLGRGVLLAAIPGLTSLNLTTIYPLVIVLYTLNLVFNTAAKAAIPDVVPDLRLLAANGVLNAMDNVADIAYGLGGALIFVLGFQVPFYLDALTFFVSAATVYSMRIPGRARNVWPDVPEVVRRIRDGIDFIRGHPFLKWSTLAFTVAPAAGGAGYVLAPLYAQRSLAHSAGIFGPLHSGAFRFSLLELALGLGSLLGSTYMLKRLGRRPRGQIFGAGLVGTGLADALLATTGNVYLACLFLALSGMFFSIFIITGSTLGQSLTPTEMRGRVVAARVTVINGALLLGSALGGLALLKFSVETLWLFEGIIIAAASLFVWLVPEVRSQP